MAQRNKSQLTREEAETIAMEALRFLASQPQRIIRFLSLSGLEPGELAQQAESPALLAGYLAFLLDDESLLLVFAAETGIDAGLVAPAHALLAGVPDA
jgi:Protein of unknown function (DUF3572)